MDQPVGRYDAVLYETRGQVAVLTLNRPERLNAISQGLRREVHEAVGRARDDDEIRALIIIGAGRGFCSGADLLGGADRAAAAAQTGAPPPPTSQSERLDEMSWVGRWAKLFYDFDKPLIGAINGVAAGAGMSMALACDVRIGTPESRFKTVFVERNLSPDSGMSFFLPRIVGYAAAADLIFTSRNVDAEEAHRLGLLNRIVPADRLLDEAMAYAEQMAQWPPLAIRSAKRVLQHSMEKEIDEALRYEHVGLGFARKAVNDAKESRLAFLEKRKGVYTGS
ncbi:MAG TPA: enoyl-CoA hydratase/isomerase family protein [Phenylobacterium sp.]